MTRTRDAKEGPGGPGSRRSHAGRGTGLEGSDVERARRRARGDIEPAGTIAGDWLISALVESSDLVFAFDPDTIITWCNPAVFRILGFPPAEVIGHSIADFIHPDDLERAAEVVGLSAAGAFDEMPITPALYRGRHADGSWVNLDLNGATGPDGSMLIVARLGGDLVLNDRLLEAVSGGEPFDTQVAMVLEMGTWRHPPEGYAILYLDEDGTPRAETWNLPPELYGAAPVPGPTPWDMALVTGKEVVINDLTNDLSDGRLASPALVEAALAAGFQGCLAAPIADPDHLDGACIVIWTTAEGPTTSGHRYAMGNMRRAFALVLQQRSQVRGLELAARVDQLTGLTSRARFLDLLDEIEDRAETTERHVLLYLDLDGFKPVNDSLGHGAGDVVLTETAARVRDAAPPGAVVARLGGDEFGVLCPSETTAAEAEALAQRIIDDVSAPIRIADDHAAVSASIGVAVGRAGEGPTSVLTTADAALLKAKADGRGRWCRLNTED